MTAFSYPSFLFPERPAFTVDLPDGWEPDFVDGTEFAAKATVAEGEFTPSLIVTTQRVAGSANVEDAAQGVVNAIATLPGVQVYGQEYRDVLDSPGIHIELSVTPPDSEPIFQAILVAVVENGPVSDIVSFAATCTIAQAQTRVGQLRDILNSISADDD